jgi:hypothetical protein
MKAVAIILLTLLVALGLITAEGMYIFATTSNIESAKRSVVEIGITALINQVEFAKKSLNQALDYSIYQAIYNVMSNGGYENPVSVPNPKYNNLPYWRVYDNTYFPFSYQTTLNTAISNIFNNEYITSLKTKTDVQIPIYSLSTNVFGSFVLPSTVESGWIEVSATSAENIKLEKPNVTISDNPNIDRTVSTNFKPAFDLGKSYFIDKDSIGQAINDVIKNLNFAQSGGLSQCGPCPSPDTVFSLANNGITVQQAKDSIEAGIRNEINKLKGTFPGLVLDIEILDVKSYINLDCACTDLGVSCCCGVDPCCTGSPCGATDSDGNCINTCASCCVCFDTFKQTNCNFYYYGAAKFLVKITDTANSYPIYDFQKGTTNYRNSILNFYVISGNSNLISP